MQVGVWRVRCFPCGYRFEDAAAHAAAGNKRAPCPSCGSKGLIIDVEDGDAATTHVMLRLTKKLPGKGRVFRGKFGDELHHETGRWQRITRTVDRHGDWYRERITDYETGDLVRARDEPLSEHRGRGSARHRTLNP